METYIEKIKTTLYDLIHEMSEHYWLYVSDPGRNFSRDRKLPFEKVLAMLISMGGGSLRNELIDHFHCSADMALGILGEISSACRRRVDQVNALIFARAALFAAQTEQTETE